MSVESYKNVYNDYYSNADENVKAILDSSGLAEGKNPLGSMVGRNDPCPCGCQKEYKHCHGKN